MPGQGAWNPVDRLNSAVEAARGQLLFPNFTITYYYYSIIHEPCNESDETREWGGGGAGLQLYDIMYMMHHQSYNIERRTASKKQFRITGIPSGASGSTGAPTGILSRKGLPRERKGKKGVSTEAEAEAEAVAVAVAVAVISVHVGKGSSFLIYICRILMGGRRGGRLGIYDEVFSRAESKTKNPPRPA